jgi:hypothetical protein
MAPACLAFGFFVISHKLVEIDARNLVCSSLWITSQILCVNNYQHGDLACFWLYVRLF